MDKHRVDRLPWSENIAPVCDSCGSYGLIVPAEVEYYDGTLSAWYCSECDPCDDGD